MQVNLYQERVLVFGQPVDFRKSIPGLLQIIASAKIEDARDGIYVFYNRHRDKIKCLLWHKNGFILLCKYLTRGKFPFKYSVDGARIQINKDELTWLLAGLEWQKMRDWEELNYHKFS